MSQPASPIGSVEFIVKFESLQGSFVNALKEAFEEADIDFGDTDPKKLDEILYNLRNRIRQPFTGDRLNFVMEAQQHKTLFEKQETKEQLAAWFATEEVGKRMLPPGEEEDPEDYKERVMKTSGSFLDAIVNMIETGIDDPDFWKKHAIDFVDISAGFTAALKGNWNYLMRNVFTKVIKESELEKIGREAARAGGFKHIWTPAGQKRASKLLEQIGTEEVVEGGDPKKRITNFGEFMEAMMKTLSQERFKEEVEKAGGATPGMSPEEKQAFLDKFYVDIGVEIPNIFAKAFGVEYGKEKGEYHLRDLPLYIWGAEGKKEYGEWLKSFGIVNEKMFNEFMAEIEARILESGGTAATLEGKRFVTEASEAEAQEKYKGLLGMFGMMGKAMVQVLPEFANKTADQVQISIEKAMQQVFKGSIDLILANVGSTKIDLAALIQAIKDDPKLTKTIGSKL